MQSKEKLQALAEWLNKNVPFIEIAAFTHKILNPKDVFLFQFRLNKWVYKFPYLGYKSSSRFKIRERFLNLEERISKLDATISHLREIYSTKDVDRILRYEKKLIDRIRDPKKNTNINIESFQRKYFNAQYISTRDIIEFIKWKFDITDEEEEIVFPELRTQSASPGDDYIIKDSDETYLDLPEKIIPYQQRENDFLYRPGGKGYKLAQRDFYNPDKKGQKVDIQRSITELGPFRLEEKLLNTAVECIQRYFDNNTRMTKAMLQHYLQEDSEEYPMLIVVLEKEQISLAEYLTGIVVFQKS